VDGDWKHRLNCADLDCSDANSETTWKTVYVMQLIRAKLSPAESLSVEALTVQCIRA
jgi:hypothetical protein